MPGPEELKPFEGGKREEEQLQNALLALSQLLMGGEEQRLEHQSPIKESFAKVFKSFSKHATPMHSADPKDPDMGMLLVDETGATIDKHSYLVHRLQVSLLEQLADDLEVLYQEGKLHQEGQSPQERLIEAANTFMNRAASQKAVEGYLSKYFGGMNLSPTVKARLAHNVHMGLVPVVAEALNYAVGNNYITAISPNLKSKGQYFELTERKSAKVLQPHMLSQEGALDKEYTHIAIYPDIPGKGAPLPMMVRLSEPVKPSQHLAALKADEKTGVIHHLKTVNGLELYPELFMPHVGNTADGAVIINEALAPKYPGAPLVDFFSKMPTSMQEGSKASVKIDGVANDIPQSRLTTSRTVGSKASLVHNRAFTGALLYRVLAGNSPAFLVSDLGGMAAHSCIAVNHGRDALQDIYDNMADIIIENRLDGSNLQDVRGAFIASISPMLDAMYQVSHAPNDDQRDLAAQEIIELAQSTAAGKLFYSQEGRRLLGLLSLPENIKTFIETGWEPLLTVCPDLVKGDLKTLESVGAKQWAPQFERDSSTSWEQHVSAQSGHYSWAESVDATRSKSFAMGV